MALHQRLFFLFLIFLPAQLGFHFWPAWAFVLGRRVDYLSPTIFFTDVLVVLLLISWFFECLHRKFSIFPASPAGRNFQFSIKQKNFKFLKKKLLPLFFLLSFITINIVAASSIPVALYKWLKIGEFAALGWYIAQTKPKISFIVPALSIGVFYSSLLAIVQFFLQQSLGGLFWFFGERTFTVDTPGIARLSWCLIPGSWCRELLRPYATFPHPNVLGGYLAVLLPVIIQYTNNQRVKLSNVKRFFFITTIILEFFALLLTFSRSAWMAGGIGIGIMYLVLRKEGKNFLPPLIRTTIPLILLLLVLSVKFNASEESVVVRQQLNQIAVNMWQTSPLFGVGIGNFLVELPKYLVSRDIYFLQPVHNIYLLILAETGSVGLAFFLWLLWKIFKHKHSIIHYSLFTILLLGFVDHYPYTLQQGQLLFVIFLALSISYRGELK